MSESSDQQFMVLGRIGAPFGLKGFSHVYSFMEVPEDLLAFPEWGLGINGELQGKQIIESIKPHGDHFIAKFKDSQTCDDAACYTNLDIMLPRGVLPELPQGEYYWSELIGMQVINQQDELLGIVTEMRTTGANDVLVVKANQQAKSQILIPFVQPTYVLKVDMPNQAIRVDWHRDWS